jgi:hypothetical protein
LPTVMGDFVGAATDPVAPGAGAAAPDVAAPGVAEAAAPPDEPPAALAAEAPPAPPAGFCARPGVLPAPAAEVLPPVGLAIPPETVPVAVSPPGVAAAAAAGSTAGSPGAPAVTPAVAPGAVITREAACSISASSRRVPQAPTSGTATRATSSRTQALFLLGMFVPLDGGWSGVAACNLLWIL